MWESHADSGDKKGRRNEPERAIPIYMVDDAGDGRDDQPVAAVTTSPTAVPEQLESLLRRLLPTPTPVPSQLEQLLQQLLGGGGGRTGQPTPPSKTGITAMETLLQNLLPVSQSAIGWKTATDPGRGVSRPDQ